MTQDRDPSGLRSQRWFAAEGMRAFSHRQRMQQMGFRRDELVGRPVIGILNTWIDLSPCHAHLREREVELELGAVGLLGHFLLDARDRLLGRLDDLWRNLFDQRRVGGGVARLHVRRDRRP